MLKRFLREEKGQDVIEWGLLAGFLGIGILALVTFSDIPSIVSKWYKDVNDAIDDPTQSQ
ncbi:MAG: hypothetical protein Kow0074_17010 [Candidatus Zixiibacteriota bacterium]